MNERIDTVCGWIDAAAGVVALTAPGSRPSPASPTFAARRACGRKIRWPKKLSNIDDYMADPDVRKLSWQSRLGHPVWRAQPNAGHRALAELERRGKLHALIMQNIDGRHRGAGNTPARVGAILPLLCGARVLT